MHRPLAAALLIACLLDAGALASRARADDASTLGARARVAVDWSGVADADVARCGLSRLRAGTLERLVDEGHAVVDASGDDGVAVTVASSGAGSIHVEVRAGDAHGEHAFVAGEDCDATFVLEVITAIAELVEQVAREHAHARASIDASPGQAPSSGDVSAGQVPARGDVDHADTRPRRAPFQGSIDLTGRLATASALLLGGGLGGRLRLPGAGELGLRLELTYGEHRGVTLIEGFAGVLATLRPPGSPLGAYLELGPLLHAADSDVRSVAELDGALAVGPELSLGHLVVQLLAQLRLRRFEHRVNGDKAFDTGYFGVVLRIAAQLSPQPS